MATEGIAKRSKWRWHQHLTCAVTLTSCWGAIALSIHAAETNVPSTVLVDAELSSQSTSAGFPASINAPSVGDQAGASSGSLASPLAPSINPSATAVELALNKRGTIQFRKTSLQEVVFLLSDLWQVNIVAGEKVTGEISGVFTDAPLRDVLSAILTSSGYGYTSAGNSLIVLPIEEVGTGSPEFRQRTLPLSITDETQRASTIEAAKMLLSDRGRIQAFGSGSVLVIDLPDRIAQVERMFVELQAATQTPGGAASQLAPPTSSTGGTPVDNSTAATATGWAEKRIAYFTPQYTEASEMGVSLTAALGNGVGANAATADAPIVAVYEEENRIMVKGTPQQLSLAAEAFQQLDVPRAQVRITALIYDVNLEELEALGVQWGRGTLGGQAVAKSLEFASLVPTGAIAETGLSTLSMSSISNDLNASLMVEALDSISEAKLLANPSITVGDRREATIKIVTQIPFRTAETPDQANSPDGTSVITQQIPTVEFREAGITLVVRPRISNDGMIEMAVKPRHSTQTGTVNFLPIIDEREAETTVRVANGHTFVMGGLRQKKMVENVVGIPYLQDMKYFGKLFQSHNTLIQESELIVFLKPEIVSPCYAGLPREQQASQMAMGQLDRIAYATNCPLTRDCNDRNCPNHRPRLRVNGGSEELAMFGDYGMTPCLIAYPDDQAAYLSETLTAGTDAPVTSPLPDNVNQSSQPIWANHSFDSTTDVYPPVHVAPYETIPAPRSVAP